MNNPAKSNHPADHYAGGRTIDGLCVTVNGKALPTFDDLVTYSKGGFEWGYEGAEPLQLAFALLYSRLRDVEAACELAPVLMKHIVANLANEWDISGDQLDETIAILQGKHYARAGHVTEAL